ncbi:MAG: DUF2497 domain-containing protein [Rickettsiales bacterium]
MAEANTDAAKEGEEPSMEDILQSIKKIIADDDAPEGEGSAEEAPAVNGDANEDVPGSDVLELTEEAPAEEAATEEAATETKEEAPAEATAEEAGNDVLSKIDEALAEEKPAEAPAAPAETPAEDDDKLLSEQAAQAATSSVKKLQEATEPPLPDVKTTPSPEFLSGNSVEAMAMNMLKPMMKEWLDQNLPSIVERLVAIEIRKLTK